MSSCVQLCEDQLQCPVCLEVFTQPVSIPCGHNFCQACIQQYWAQSKTCSCPVCKRRYKSKPKPSVNTVLAEMANQFKRKPGSDQGPVKGGAKRKKQGRSEGEEEEVKEGEVPCDVCVGRKRKALNSCLVCQASYCETHLEPHHRVASFKRHKLIQPVENLEDRVCQKHQKPLEMFCRTDQTCVCQFCLETDHKTHTAVPVDEEVSVRKAEARKMRVRVLKMIQDRKQKITSVGRSATLREKEMEKEKEESKLVFSALEKVVKYRQTELLKKTEKRQTAADQQAKRMMGNLEQEIDDLNKRSSELRTLSTSNDPLDLLQTSSHLLSLPNTRDWSGVDVDGDLGVGTFIRTVTEMEMDFHQETEKLRHAELKRIQRYAVDVTWDPETANPTFQISADGKTVKVSNAEYPANPKRFDNLSCVLGKQGISSGRFCCEVMMEGNEWTLGVAKESIERKKDRVLLDPTLGLWTIGHKHGEGTSAYPVPPVPLSLRSKPDRVGVFVDYEAGEVSFYDVQAKSHIYSFTGQSFTETLHLILYSSSSGSFILGTFDEVK